MIHYTVGRIAEIVDGDLVGNPDVAVECVCIDSRLDLKGALFVALKGDNFDGHDFICDVSLKNACAVLVSREFKSIDIPQIVVSDTLAALTKLATFHRTQFANKVAAITGSAGKTTTRALLSEILKVQYLVHEPEKNFNNHIGVPLTMMKLTDEFDMAVFELGCSDFHEIAGLTNIVQPDVAVVTNVGSAHLEKLENLEGVALAKGELFANLNSDAIAVVNIDDPFVVAMPRKCRHFLTFSTKSSADVRLLHRVANPTGQQLSLDVQGQLCTVQFPLPGEHNAIDATAATAAALAMGASVADVQMGLTRVKARPGRFDVKQKNGITVIDDTYNANPSSMEASLQVLAEMALPKHRIAVLGDMLELGQSAQAAHLSLGAFAASLDLEYLLVVGTNASLVQKGALDANMPPKKLICLTTNHELAKKVTEILKFGDVLLIKGSRGMKMEEVVTELLKG